MKKILIISSSIRQGRKSHRVALFFKSQIDRSADHEAEILDLKEKNFPIFHERLAYTNDPSPELLMLSEQIRTADGIIIVTPEYNGGYPASLKNVVDVLYDEWKRKPVAISTVSDGAFGGTQVITSLSFSLFKIGLMLVPAMFPCPMVDKLFEEDGTPKDEAKTLKKSEKFLKELYWCIQAKSLSDSHTGQTSEEY